MPVAGVIVVLAERASVVCVSWNEIIINMVSTVCQK